MSLIRALAHGIVANWGVLAPAVMLILANVVTATTRYPQGSVESMVGALARFVMVLLDRLAVVPHKDSEPHVRIGGYGFNVPLARSWHPLPALRDVDPDDVPTQRNKTGGLLSFAAVFLLGASVVGGVLHGCAATNRALVAGRACEIATLDSSLWPVLLQVAAVLLEPSKTPLDLQAIGTGLIPGQLECVVDAVEAAIKPPANASLAPWQAAALVKIAQFRQLDAQKAFPRSSSSTSPSTVP